MRGVSPLIDEGWFNPDFSSLVASGCRILLLRKTCGHSMDRSLARNTEAIKEVAKQRSSRPRHPLLKLPCYKFQQKGLLQRDCPSSRKTKPFSGLSITDNWKTRECDTFDDQFGSSGTKAYYVPAKFENVQAVLMLDSGCSRSIISQSVASVA